MAKKQPSTNPDFIDPRRPLEYNPKQVRAALKNGPMVAAYKHDGVRLHITCKDGQVFIWSRSKLPFPGLALYGLTIPEAYLSDLEGYTIEAEAITFDGVGNPKPAAEISGDLQRIKPEVLPRGRVTLELFDLHNEETRKWGYLERLEDMSHKTLRVQRLCHKLGFAFANHPEFKLCHTEEEVSDYYLKARRWGYEGLVVTPSEAPYTSGKKVASGWKLKPEETLEATINGFIEAISKDGTPKSQVGSFEVTFEDGTEGRINAGALTHLERAEVWYNKDTFRGRLCEVNAMERTADGKARHGNFFRWRDTVDNKGVKV